MYRTISTIPTLLLSHYIHFLSVDKKSKNTKYSFQHTKHCGFDCAKPNNERRQDKKCTIKKKICFGHRKNLWVFITADLLKLALQLPYNLS